MIVAIHGSIAAIGAICWLLFTLATYALPGARRFAALAAQGYRRWVFALVRVFSTVSPVAMSAMSFAS